MASTEHAAAGRRLILRADGSRQLAKLAVAFGVTVVLIRLFLALTGYPQIGGGQYHIAHARWGGLLLMVAAMLPLVWANRRVRSTAAVLAGVGTGLFVDEVGKFITAANNYFTPLAAPIIYLALLGIVALADVAARPRGTDARSVAYAVLDLLGGVVDGALSPARTGRSVVPNSRARASDPKDRILPRWPHGSARLPLVPHALSSGPLDISAG